MSTPKTIGLGLTGSIAAHKAADLTSLLTKAGHQVHSVITVDAQRFITPLPFKTLSLHPVIKEKRGHPFACPPASFRLRAVHRRNGRNDAIWSIRPWQTGGAIAD